MSQFNCNLQNVINSRLMELKMAFDQQINLQNQKDVALERELEHLKAHLKEKEAALFHIEEKNKKLELELLEKNKELSKHVATIAELSKNLNIKEEELAEKSRALSLAKNENQIGDRRLENMRIELAGYLLRLNETKKKLKLCENESMQYLGMYTRVNEMFHKASDDVAFFKERCDLQDEFIQTLLTTLKQHGIYDFESEGEAENDSSPTNAETKEDVTVEEIATPPLRHFPTFQLSSKLPTILEVDEDDEECDNSTHESKSVIPPPSANPPAKVVISIESEADESGIFTETHIESSNTSAISELEENPKKKWRKSKNSSKKRQEKKKKEIVLKEVPKPKTKRRYTKIIFSMGCF